MMSRSTLASAADVLMPRTLGAEQGVTGLGVGTARLGAFWQGRSPQEGLRALEAALDLGVSLVDTADVYARGIAERIVGRAVAGRPEVAIMTKGGLLKTPAALARAAAVTGRRPSPSGLRASATAGRCFHPDYLSWALDGSLRRLGAERVAVYLLHEPDLATVGDPAIHAAMEALVASGKVGAWGVSTPEPEVALAALDLPGTPWVQALIGPDHVDLAQRLASHPRRHSAVLVGIGALGDGTLVPRACDASGLPAADVVAALLDAAVRRTRPDAVLVGMSTKDHVVRNLARLRSEELVLDGSALDRVLTAVGKDRP